MDTGSQKINSDEEHNVGMVLVPAITLQQLSYTIILAVLSLFCVAFLWPYPLISLLCMLVCSALLYLVRPSRKEFLLWVYAAISGFIAESIAMYFGAWSYTHTTIFASPLWLAPLWGIAAVFIVRIFTSLFRVATYSE